MTSFQAKLLLLSVFAARGTSFLFSKVLLLSMSPENVLAVRFLLSFAVLAVIFYKKLLRCSKSDLEGGIILGVLYTLCMFFEMHGLRTVDTGVAAFVENMASRPDKTGGTNRGLNLYFANASSRQDAL